MKPQYTKAAIRLLLGLTVGTFLSGTGFAQSTTPPSASNPAPSPWDQQPNAGATQVDALFPDYKFRDGQTLDRVKIHYGTLGKPHHNAQGDIDNAVLVLHWTGADSRVLLSPTFAKRFSSQGARLMPADIT